MKPSYSKSIKRETLLDMLYKRDRQIEELMKANREISAALDRVLNTRDKIKEEIADSISEEIEALSDKISDYQAFGTPDEIEEERAAMLEALGMDEFDWDRNKWRFL